MPSLPIIELCLDSYRQLFKTWRLAWRIGAIPCALAAVAVYLCAAARHSLPASAAADWSYYLASRGAAAAALTIVAVGWHRLILLGQVPSSFAPTWGRHHTVFFSWFIALTLLSEVPGFVPASLVAPAGAGVLAVIGLFLWAMLAYLAARLSFVLPASAVEDRSSACRAWKRTARNGIRLAVASAIAPFPIYLALSPLLLLSPEIAIAVFLIACAWALAPVVAAIEAGVLSFAYRRVIE